MTISHSEFDTGADLVQVAGRLDQSLTVHLETLLLQLFTRGRHQIVVDLSETSYINSGGLRCLVAAWRKSREQQGQFVLCGLSPRLQEIFSMVGFDQVFQIFPDCEAAKEAVIKMDPQ